MFHDARTLRWKKSRETKLCQLYIYVDQNQFQNGLWQTAQVIPDNSQRVLSSSASWWSKESSCYRKKGLDEKLHPSRYVVSASWTINIHPFEFVFNLFGLVFPSWYFNQTFLIRFNHKEFPYSLLSKQSLITFTFPPIRTPNPNVLDNAC